MGKLAEIIEKVKKYNDPEEVKKRLHNKIDIVKLQNEYNEERNKKIGNRRKYKIGDIEW